MHQVSRDLILPPDGVNRVLRLSQVAFVVVIRPISVRTYNALSHREVDPILVEFGAAPYFLCYKVTYCCF